MDDYAAKLVAAGFQDVVIEHAPDEGRGWTGGYVKATKPSPP